MLSHNSAQPSPFQSGSDCLDARLRDHRSESFPTEGDSLGESPGAPDLQEPGRFDPCIRQQVAIVLRVSAACTPRRTPVGYSTGTSIAARCSTVEATEPRDGMMAGMASLDFTTSGDSGDDSGASASTTSSFGGGRQCPLLVAELPAPSALESGLTRRDLPDTPPPTLLPVSGRLSSPTSTLVAPFGEVGGGGVGSTLDGNEVEMAADSDTAEDSPASSPSNSPASLWKPAVDEKSGKLYWWNTETRKVQWREPDEVVVKVSFLWAFPCTAEEFTPHLFL